MSPENVAAVVALVVVFGLVVLLMARSWRKKQEASSQALPSLPSVPERLGEARTGELEGTYVATTSADDFLARVTGHGLGVKAPAVAQVHDAGVVVRRTGAPDLFVPAVDLVGAFRSGGMTGKYTGGKALVVLRWRLHDPDRSVVLDTGLHLRHAADRDAFTAAATALAPTTPEETP